MAQFQEIYVDQGADFSTILTLTDDVTGLALNVLGYVVTANAKTSYVTPNVSFSFVCTVNDAANGNVSMSLPGTTSANVKPRAYVFDLKTISPTNAVSRIIQGTVDVNAQVT